MTIKKLWKVYWADIYDIPQLSRASVVYLQYASLPQYKHLILNDVKHHLPKLSADDPEPELIRMKQLCRIPQLRIFPHHTLIITLHNPPAANPMTLCCVAGGGGELQRGAEDPREPHALPWGTHPGPWGTLHALTPLSRARQK